MSVQRPRLTVPRINMHRAAVKKIFDEVYGNQQFISQAEAKDVLLKLNPGYGDKELSTIFETLEKEKKMVQGQISIEKFIDHFCPPLAHDPALAKPLSEQDEQAVQAAFKEFDKDNSGFVDLKELRAISEKMGKKLAEKEANEAFRMLDKNGDGRCNYDEFKLWWTCTPGLGGYNHMIFGYLKTKLAVKNGLRRITGRVMRQKLTNSEEFRLVYKLAARVGQAEPEAKSKIELKMNKKEAPQEGVQCIVTLGAKDEGGAAAIQEAIETFATTDAGLELREAKEQGMFVIRHDANKVIITMTSLEAANSTEMKEVVDILRHAVSNLEATLNFDFLHDEVLAHPKRKLMSFTKGFFMRSAMSVNLQDFLIMSDGAANLPPGFETWGRILGGWTFDTKFQYSEKDWRNLALGSFDGGLYDARQMLYKYLVDEGVIGDGAVWNESGIDEVLPVVRALGNNSTGIDSITLDGLAGTSGTIEFVLNFENFNPFGVINSLVGHLPNSPNQTSETAQENPRTAAIKGKTEDAFGGLKKTLSRAAVNFGDDPNKVANLTFNSELTPALEECKDKMRLEVYMLKEEEAASGPPCLKFKLSAKSAEAATHMVQKFDEAIAPFKPMIEQVAPIACNAEGSQIVFSVAIPSEMVNEFYDDPDAVDVFVPLLNSVANSTMKVQFANTFDDFLAAPDKSYIEVFDGIKFCGNVAISYAGRKFVETTLVEAESMLPPEQRSLAKIWKCFSGINANSLAGYNKEVLAAFLASDAIPEEMRPFLSLASLKAFLVDTVTPQVEGMFPDGAVPPEMASYFKMLATTKEILDNLDSLDSASVENVNMPPTDDNAASASFGLHVKFENVKPFGLVSFFTEPVMAVLPKPAE